MNKLSVTNLFSSTYLLQYIMLTIQKKVVSLLWVLFPVLSTLYSFVDSRSVHSPPPPATANTNSLLGQLEEIRVG